MNSQNRVGVGIGLGLLVITIAAYWRVFQCDFVGLDDGEYVTDNLIVQNGLTLKGAWAAFSSFHAANWHPLTWLSLMADYQLFGKNPAAFHAVNLAFHVANVLLLFIALWQMTSQPWRSGLVAALFAVHPLHVESVAWIAERKDVLSGLFWMLVLISYHTYVVRPGLTRYLVVLAMLSLGLMSKTMLVTLPCVLLLLDVWPFRRIDHPFLNRLPFRASASNGAAPDPSGTPRIPQISLTSDLLEKVPLLLLSSVASYLTLLAQRPAIESATVFVPSSIEERLSNALMSYVAYLEKMIWPFGLCCFYPYGVNQTSIAGLLVAIILLMAITYFAIVSFAKTPAILVGWLWYLGTLVPVIGLVQVGGQAMADRYTYLPLIGVFIALVWMLRPSYGGIRLVGLTSGLVTTILVGLVIRCDQQVATWQNTSTLFRQAYAVDPKNWRAAFFLAEDCVENGKLNMAVKFYREAASLLQTSDGFQVGCGVRLMKLGQITDAAECFAKAVQINPSEAEHHRRWGLTFVEQHQIKAAEEQFREAIRLKPDHAAAHSNLGAALMDLGQLREADLELREAIRLDPRDQIAVKNLEIVSEAIRKNPAP